MAGFSISPWGILAGSLAQAIGGGLGGAAKAHEEIPKLNLTDAQTDMTRANIGAMPMKQAHTRALTDRALSQADLYDARRQRLDDPRLFQFQGRVVGINPKTQAPTGVYDFPENEGRTAFESSRTRNLDARTQALLDQQKSSADLRTWLDANPNATPQERFQRILATTTNPDIQARAALREMRPGQSYGQHTLTAPVKEWLALNGFLDRNGQEVPGKAITDDILRQARAAATQDVVKLDATKRQAQTAETDARLASRSSARVIERDVATKLKDVTTDLTFASRLNFEIQQHAVQWRTILEQLNSDERWRNVPLAKIAQSRQAGALGKALAIAQGQDAQISVLESRFLGAGARPAYGLQEQFRASMPQGGDVPAVAFARLRRLPEMGNLINASIRARVDAAATQLGMHPATKGAVDAIRQGNYQLADKMAAAALDAAKAATSTTWEDAFPNVPAPQMPPGRPYAPPSAKPGGVTNFRP